MESMKDHMVKLPMQMEKGQMGLDDFHMDLAIDILKKNEKVDKKESLIPFYNNYKKIEYDIVK